MSNHPDTAALEPHLVAGVEIVDSTNLIFHVQEGVKFHSGTPYTAEDLAFNWERVSAAAEYHQGGETSDHPNGLGHGSDDLRDGQLRQLRAD